MLRTVGGVIVNDRNEILLYTVASSSSQCEEEAIARWGEELWNKLKALGCKIVNCEVIVSDVALENHWHKNKE